MHAVARAQSARAHAPRPASEDAPAARDEASRDLEGATASAGPDADSADLDPPLPAGDAPRKTPDYAGRDSRKNAGEVLLWAPRVLLFPAWVVSEYVIRRPVGALYTMAEKHRLVARFDDFFTFGEERKIGLFPAGRIDLGFSPTVGVYFFWRDVVGASDLKLRATTGGVHDWELKTQWHVPLSERDRLRFNVSWSLRPDRAFYGLGDDVRDDPARFTESRFDGRLAYAGQLNGLTFFSYAGLLSVEFDPYARVFSDSSLGSAIDAGLLAPPPALEDGLLALYTGIGARLDSRPPRITPPPRTAQDLERRNGSGVAFGVRAQQSGGLSATRASELEQPRLPHWLRYGASAVGALDVTGTRRTLSLETIVEFATPLHRDNPVPFTEQVGLGGDYPLRGFRGGRLVDQSAAVATLSYRWPIWDSLDGHLDYGVGDVFGRHLDGFALDRLRSSFGVGLDSAGSLDNPFEILLAFGTEPFGEGGRIESVRFVLGTRSGF